LREGVPLKLLEVPLKLLAATAIAASVIALGGCESSGGSAILGGLGGAAAGAGGYEYHLNNQKSRVEEDLKQGKIDRREYEIRMDQISRDSLVQ
jgi:hypothetical protein